MSERLRPQAAAGVTMLARLTTLTATTSVAVFVFAGAALAGQESLSAARDLYASAKYEDALVVLDRLRQADRAADGTNVPDAYRPMTSPGVWVPTTPQDPRRCALNSM